MLPHEGERFGPYEILAELGGGGMGVVFRAWDERLHREVAVKVLRDEYQAPGMRDRFLLEARAASALNHPNICMVFDLGSHRGEPYMVMELLEGKTLRDKIAQQACSSEEIVNWARKVADALAAAHNKGIIHRDIKPANIFLQNMADGQTQVKVLDFGLAKVSMALRSGRDSRALEMTTAGYTVGTLAYMSPEQARGESLDTRSDLFSLGAVLYEMATRRPPFRGPTTALVFQALLSANPDPIRTWNATIPRELERTIQRLLTKDRHERFQTAREVQEALDKLSTRNEGEWLRKLPRAVIPLVAAGDPVARKRRGLRRSSSSGPVLSEVQDGSLVPNEADAALPSGPSTSDSAARMPQRDNLLRPLRLPMRESRPRETRFARRDSEGEEVRSSDSSSAFVLSDAAPGTNVESHSDSPQAVSGVVLPSRGTAPSGSVPAAWSAPRQQPVTSPATPVSAPSPSSSSTQQKLRTKNPEFSNVDEAGEREGIIANIMAKSDSAPNVLQSVSDDDLPAVDTLNADETKSTNRQRLWLCLAGVALILLVTLIAFEFGTGGLGQIVLAPGDTLLLGSIDNRTPDPVLSGAVQAGLRTELEFHSRLHWLGIAAERAALHQLGAQSHTAPQASLELNDRSLAELLHARAYVHGELSSDGSGYNLRLDIIEAGSNDRLGSVQRQISSRADIPSAIVAAAQALRHKLGEGATQQRALPSIPLERLATNDLGALDDYNRAEQAQFDGDPRRASSLYEEAVRLSPSFTVAYLRLAWIYAAEGAELAASDSAALALTAAAHADPQLELLARTAVEALTLNDTNRAGEMARELTALRPNDAEALLALARTMRLGGHMTEALLSAEQAYKQHPYLPDAYQEASLALIGLERFADARTTAAAAAQKGVICECGRTLTSYLLGAAPDATQAAAASFDQRAQDALLLDDAGDLSASASVWRSAAAEARSDPHAISASAGMLATAALHEALSGRCSDAASLAQEASRVAYGRLAAFHLALEETLCSRSGSQIATDARTNMLEGADRNSVMVRRFEPLLTGAELLAAHKPAEALALTSAAAADRDPLPLALYLHALARKAADPGPLTTQDLQEVARRHGYALLTDSTVASLAAQALNHSAQQP